MFILAFSSLFSENATQSFLHDIEGKNKKIGYLFFDMDQPINQTAYVYVKLALDRYAEEKVALVVLHLDTPGGEVFAAQKIAHLLQDFYLQYHIPTLAFIDNWAISAGAMLAYSCRYIVAEQSSAMGAAEPVFLKDGTMESASEKVNSALRAEFSNCAAFFQRDPLIAEAMVDKDLLLVKRGKEFIKLSDEKEIQKGDEIVSGKGKLLTLNSKKLVEFGVADFFIEKKSTLKISKEEAKKGQWLAKEDPLFQTLPFSTLKEASIITYKDWKISLFSILSNPLVSSILVAILMIAFYATLSTGHFGSISIVGLIALFLLLITQFSIYTISYIELLILFAGLILILLELFVLPTSGFVITIGTILTIIGLFTLALPNLKGTHFSLDPAKLNLAALYILNFIAYLIIATLIAMFIIVLLAKYYLPSSTLFKRFVLHAETGKEYVEENLNLLNAKGIAQSQLRLSGKVLINGQILDAISEKDFIEKGEPIIIIRVEGNKIVVKKDR